MNPQTTGRLLAGCTIGVSAYCLCWLFLPPFYKETRAIQLLFPSPFYLLYLGASGVLFLILGSLCVGGILMLRYDDPRLSKKTKESSSRCVSTSLPPSPHTDVLRYLAIQRGWVPPDMILF
ncbi:putative transmembrane protein [Toxoplasma gondii VAND]|uniref:Putative transmembrane protein n=1 Tax=Toxoplasma gondii VAND TaxID=933077 RepID=A0A086PVP0_TOXGO|nr:putative transmembrane protein [Toxoplasma gondii VAND]